MARDLETIAHTDGRYRPEAYVFVNQSLRHAARMYRKEEAVGEERHLTAHQLVLAALDLAADRFGMLGVPVLHSWGLRAAEDIGTITFALIQHGVFTKQDRDRIEDFYAGPDFPVEIGNLVRARLAQPAKRPSAKQRARKQA